MLTLALLPIALLAPPVQPAPAPTAAAIRKPADLYQIDRVWEVHLTFTPEQWKAIEPKREDEEGPGFFLGPSFLSAADTDHDKKITAAEFHTLAETWFTAWDAKKAGSVGLDEVKDGLNAAIKLPDFGAPGGALQGKEGQRNGVAAMSGVNFDYVHANVEFGGRAFKDVAVRYKGNGTFLEAQGIKRPLKIDLDKYVDGQNLGGVTTLNLHNCVTDNTWMNDAMGHRLFRDAGVPAPRTAYARVYITVPGVHSRKYFGLYELVEEVGKSFAQDNFGNDTGAILKPVTPRLFEYLGEDWKKYVQTYDPKTKLTDAQKKRVQEFCKVVTQSDEATFTARFGEFVDIDELARYLAAMVYISEIDGIFGPGQNLYLYLSPTDDKFRFIPWDLDHSWGHFPNRSTQQKREQLSIEHPWQGDNSFLERAFKVPALKQRYLGYLRRFSTTIFLPQRFIAQVDALAPVLRPAVSAESPKLLARFDKLIAGQTLQDEPNPDQRGEGGPNGEAPEPFKPIKAFVPIRTRSIDDQLAGRSKGMEPGKLNIFGPPEDENGNKMGAGNFINVPFVMMLDGNGDKKLTHAEFLAGFDRWFAQWSGGAPALTEETLRKGLDKAFAFGPPPGEGDKPKEGKKK